MAITGRLWNGKSKGWHSGLLIALMLVSLTGLAARTRVLAADNGHRDPFAIGLWGDLPYNDDQALNGVPRMIADMNAQSLAFTVHDGDLKAGHGIAGSVTPTTCSDALYQYAQDHYFSQLSAPAAFTPGDNDWTDCDAADNGPFNSLERLDHERQFFFSSSFTLGQHKLKQEVQSGPKCLGFGGGLVPCVEGVTDGFQEILLALRDEVIVFRKPVAYVHGDTHYFRLDKPFLDAQGRRLENFTRLETFGDNAPNGTNDVNWVKVRVDAESREVFSFQPQIVPGNRVAVPAP